MPKKIVFCFAIAVLFVVAFFARISFAMTISPVRLEISGDPGQTITKQMTIINDDDVPVTYYSSFANFEAQGETGSAAFIEPKDDIGTWMQTTRSVHLGPGEQETIEFSIDIPKNAEPGGHFGVIFWGSSPDTDEDGKQLAVSAKTGLIVLLSVSGEVKTGGGLLDFSKVGNKFWYNSLPVSFSYRFKNEGGDRIKPAGYIKIRNSLFITTEKLDANPVSGNILPSSTRKFNIDWINHPRAKDYRAPDGFVKGFFDTAWYQLRNFALGLYSAKLDLSFDGHENESLNTLYFFVFPWQLLICLVVIFSILFFGGRIFIRKYNNYIIRKAHSNMKMPGENDHV